MGTNSFFGILTLDFRFREFLLDSDKGRGDEGLGLCHFGAAMKGVIRCFSGFLSDAMEKVI